VPQDAADPRLFAGCGGLGPGGTACKEQVAMQPRGSPTRAEFGYLRFLLHFSPDEDHFITGKISSTTHRQPEDLCLA